MAAAARRILIQAYYTKTAVFILFFVIFDFRKQLANSRSMLYAPSPGGYKKME